MNVEGIAGAPISVVPLLTNHSLKIGQHSTRVRVGVHSGMTKARFLSPQASDDYKKRPW